MLRVACAVACRALNVQCKSLLMKSTPAAISRALPYENLLANNFHTLTSNPFALSTNPAIINISNNLLQHQQVRSVTKFGLSKGKRRTVRAVLKRFKRLDWGGWIRTRCGRHKKLWKKSPPLRNRLKQHVLVSGTQSWLLDKMVTKYWRRPKYYINDPYAPYHKRENYFATYKIPRRY
ncbi:39S ribosomal protein L35, mitochondrial [Pseudolycoriella hygida]|uniref:Large ribosomal subunit protein bL35m n=1 Tax=Pseudolycoriella hygida TaxID=35572 RepID=A0A9Q0MWQ6_9DIPT|nr:39S ribosomal protein L35, mitochondrial [Pseudolycoriella hygida]